MEAVIALGLLAGLLISVSGMLALGGRQVDGAARASRALALAATLFGREAVLRVHHLYATELPVTPYFVPEHAILLYLATPVVVFASVVVLLAPGILLLMASRTPRPARLRSING